MHIPGYLNCMGLLIALCAGPTTNPSTQPEAQPLKPNLKFPTLASYEAAIDEPAVLLQSNHLWLFAPKSRSHEAGVIFKYLVNAYEELYRIVGAHTKYKLVIYHLPDGFGGTSECVIEYDFGNLDFNRSTEWQRHRVPHVSGYIEEMAHNFVSGTKAQFG